MFARGNCSAWVKVSTIAFGSFLPFSALLLKSRGDWGSASAHAGLAKEYGQAAASVAVEATAVVMSSASSHPQKCKAPKSIAMHNLYCMARSKGKGKAASNESAGA